MFRMLAAAAAAAVLGGLGVAPAEATPNTPKTVELYAMDCGRISLTNADMFADDGSYKGVAAEMVVPCYLIRHPKGDLVWDTGLPAPAAGKPPPPGTPARSLADQLGDLGLTPADIEYVSVSHSHFDHIGNAGLFTGSTWIVDPKEREVAFNEAARKNAGTFAAYSALETAKTRLIEQPTYDVFGDGQVVIHKAPGHTPGHTVLLVRLKETGPVILTGDLWHIAASRPNRRVPRFNFDKAQTLDTMEAVEALARAEKARLILQHVPEDFAGLPKFPNPAR
ncbi:N-acyl homoserine lactonase family protein [Phenylobacterium sp.]|uniref:N-acyl homoserine lactonase family protein n=1 Tax=Phenylobacterium sp. TaxID=1871053 RepID=UPI00301E1044